MLSRDYAQGLYELGGKEEHLAPLKEVLTRRGHLKLLPQILAEYKKLGEHDARMARHKEESPEQAQTRILLELYRTLTV
jgi:hypothetical protein